jgi:hypothetical protein
MEYASADENFQKIRVGIIGANPDRGWAAQVHIPALTSLSDDFEITALSTSRRESADAASELFGVHAAFDNHQDLVNRPDVDDFCPTFEDAVARHRMLNAIETAAATGQRQTLG